LPDPSTEPRSDLTPLEFSLAPVVEAFNAATAHAKLLALLSPT
jgi:hypothetical protein